MSTPATTSPARTAPAAAAAPAAPVNTATRTNQPDNKPETKTIAADFISSGMVILSPELAEAAAPVRQRSERQQVMDKRVKELHELYLKANKPSTWSELVAGKAVGTYFLDPETTPEFRKLVNSAVSLHDSVRARWGTPFKATEKLVKQYGLPAEYVGREVVSFAILDKRSRGTSEGRSAAEIVAEKAEKSIDKK